MSRLPCDPSPLRPGAFDSSHPSFPGTHDLTGNDDLPSSNPDNDDLPNLQEFAFGTDPTVAASGPITFQVGGNVTSPGQPVAMNLAAGEGVDYRAVFGRRKNHVSIGLNHTVQFSADLQNWVNSEVLPTLLTGENSDAEIEAVSVNYPLFISTSSGYKKPTYLRVGVYYN